MYLAPGSRSVGHGRPSAKLARRTDGRDLGCLVCLQHVFFADVARTENRNERCWRCGLLYIRPSTSLFAFHKAHGGDDFETVFTRGLNGFDRRCPGGADVVDNHHARSFFMVPLDTLAHAVLLFSFAYQEAVQLPAGDGGRNYNRVGAHCEATDGLRLPSPGANFFQKDLASELGATRVEGGGAAVDIVVAADAGRKLELSQFE